jgi:hypothetical protein
MNAMRMELLGSNARSADIGTTAAALELILMRRMRNQFSLNATNAYEVKRIINSYSNNNKYYSNNE